MRFNSVRTARSNGAGAAAGKGPNAERASGLADDPHDALLREILETMEQGVILWDKDLRCVYCNDRLYSVLELPRDALRVGMTLAEYFERAYKVRNPGRGRSRDMERQLRVRRAFLKQREEVERRFHAREAFVFDRRLPSGRIVEAATRHLSMGGAVATFTDVTAAREAAEELNRARKAAEDAGKRATASLEAEKKRQQQTQMLSLLGEWLQSCKSVDEVYMVVSAHMVRLLPGTSGELYIYSSSRDVLDGACSWNGAAPLEHIHPDDCWSLRRGRSYTYGTDDVAFVCTHVAEQQSPPACRSYICIPIVAHGDTVGLLHVAANSQSDAPDHGVSSLPQLRTVAIQCAEQISLAIANVKLRDQLRDQSIRDSLTGLYNRRYLLECLRREIARVRKKSKPLSIISFDADHFKRFNDNHGHDAGDTVLRALGELMRKMFDGDEVNCRFGGEEFAILLPEVGLEAACQRAEELRAATEAMIIRYGDQNLPRLTLSLGVASFPEGGDNPSALLATADTALYRAKAEGRNRVCCQARPSGRLDAFGPVAP